MVADRLPVSSRSMRLFGQFDRRYERFVSTLPVSLGRLAGDASTFKGRRVEEKFQISSSTNPIYTCTPWLFWELFSELADEVFLDLAFAGGLVSLASVLMDHLIDGQAEQPQAVADLRRVLLREGVLQLHVYFPWKAPFWDHFRRLHHEHINSVAIECNLQKHLCELSPVEFAYMAGSKASPVLITVIALLSVMRCIHIFPQIESSLKSTCIAGQLHDDVLDWSMDLKAGHMTYFLVRFLRQEERQTRSLPAQEKILSRTNDGWEVVKDLEEAIAGYRQALAAVDGLVCPAWTAQVNEYLKTAESHQSELIRAHVIRRLGQIDNISEYFPPDQQC